MGRFTWMIPIFLGITCTVVLMCLVMEGLDTIESNPHHKTRLEQLEQLDRIEEKLDSVLDKLP